MINASWRNLSRSHIHRVEGMLSLRVTIWRPFELNSARPIPIRGLGLLAGVLHVVIWMGGVESSSLKGNEGFKKRKRDYEKRIFYIVFFAGQQYVPIYLHQTALVHSDRFHDKQSIEKIIGFFVNVTPSWILCFLNITTSCAANNFGCENSIIGFHV